MKHKTIAILGLGKVGTAMGHLLAASGHKVTAIADKFYEIAQKGTFYVPAKPYRKLSDAAHRASIIFITTSDDAIASVCSEIVANGSVQRGNAVIHMSGAGSLDLLDSARKAGANVGSIHPLQSFADIEGAIQNIPGSTFGITVDKTIEAWAETVVTDLKGIPFFIDEKNKPLYHAAACIASNYLVTLMHTAEEIYKTLGLSSDAAIRAFWPLVKGTINNIKSRGTTQSLTGPIARGDIGTIRKHIQIMKNKTPLLLNLYCEMGKLTADIALENKTLSEEQFRKIQSLLKGDLKHE